MELLIAFLCLIFLGKDIHYDFEISYHHSVIMVLAHTATNRIIEINEKAASMAFIFLSLFPHFLRTAYKALRITVQWNTY